MASAATVLPFVGVLGSVDDFSILNLCLNRGNVIVTLSPPCPTWSRAGKSQGLNHEGGWAFLEALKLCFVIQPVFIAAECVDDITSHPHYGYIQDFLTTIGYARIFDQVTPHHQVSNHTRSRWLSTWVRRDIDAMPVANSFIPMVFPREPWTSQLYEFPVPRVWADQLRLSPSELEFYADPLLLPPAKRSRVNYDAKPSQVIELRFPSGSEPLPTLCASYTNQHMLQIDHIRGKGIFAVLDQHARGISFFDPAKFCSLFGACELIVLPSKLQEAFKCVGNAITVQHGLIPLLFGIQAVFKQPLDLHNLVKQSWNARLTSVNSIIFHQGDFVFIEKIEQAVISFLSPQSPLEHQGDVRALISIPCFFRDREFRVMATHKVPDLVARILTGPDDLLRQIYLRNEDERPNGQWTMSMYAARASEWDIMLNAKTIGSIRLSQPELCEGTPSAPCFTEVISPTVPAFCSLY